MKYWETIADNLSKAGWSWGCVAAIDANGRTIWIADAHRDGKRFVVRADEKLTGVSRTRKSVVKGCHYTDSNAVKMCLTNGRKTAPVR